MCLVLCLLQQGRQTEPAWSVGLICFMSTAALGAAEALADAEAEAGKAVAALLATKEGAALAPHWLAALAAAHAALSSARRASAATAGR